MYIQYPQVVDSKCTQPASSTLLAANLNRQEYVITLLANGPFYIKRGSAASSTNFDFFLNTVGQSVIGNNYKGLITVSPTPTVGDLNVAEGQASSGTIQPIGA